MVPWTLQLAFWAQGSYFGRSSCHFAQRVRTFGVPAAILSEGFVPWALQPAILSKGFGLLALQEGRGALQLPFGAEGSYFRRFSLPF